MQTRWQTIAGYGLALAAGAFLLQWLETRYAIRQLSTEIYIVVLVALFTGLGIYVGSRLNPPPPTDDAPRNDKAIRTLGISEREIEVLDKLAAGNSNPEIARQLGISTSTVKTHLVHLYQKLGVARRTQAVHKARELNIIR